MTSITFWIRKNFPKLMVGGSVSLLISYIGYNMYQQNRFQTPVVSQTVNILSRNQRIKQLIGFPLAYRSTSTRSMNQKNNEIYYSFTVAGPRGTTNVQVTSVKKKANQIYKYNNQKDYPDEKQKLQQEIKVKEQQLLKIGQQIKNTNKQKSFFKSNKNQESKKYLQSKEIQKIKIQQQLNALKKDLEIFQQNKKKQKKDFYIPLEEEVYNQILSSGSTGNNKDKIIPADLTLCKISQLSVQLPNKSRISVIANGQNLSELGNNKQDTKVQAIPTYQFLNKRLKMDLAQLTKEQLQFYSKNKTDSMYKKYNIHRVLITIILGSCFWFGYKAIRSKKIISVNNSVLTQIVNIRFIKHPKVRELSKVKKLKVDQFITGGLTKDYFDCSASVQGISMGKIQFTGNLKEKTHEYQFTKLTFSYLQGNQTKIIDLLK